MDNWLKENDLQYIEMTIESFKSSYYIPLGYCCVIGKSPRGNYNHIVIGKTIAKAYNEVHFVHDTSPHHNGTFLDTIEYIGFLTKKLK